jgi:hypothetical protein
MRRRPNRQSSFYPPADVVNGSIRFCGERAKRKRRNRVDVDRMRTLKRTIVMALVYGAIGSMGPAAQADVSLLRAAGWDVYTTGRVAAFFSYGWGDGNPIPRPGETIPLGGGLDPGSDTIPHTAPDGTPQQATFQSLRLRSGFIPDQLGIGLTRSLSDEVSLRVYFSYWATIDSESLLKVSAVDLDAHEGYLKVDSRHYGAFTAGKILELYSRGADEADFLYHDGYALGFPGVIDNFGPTLGMIGFGVMAPYYSPGFQYTTPKLWGVELSAAIYDPTTIPESYDATRTPRFESELTYDWSSGMVRVHLFGNYANQAFYIADSNVEATAYGFGYGGRLEVGPAHFAFAGHGGKGLGLEYAFQPGLIATANDHELRRFEGLLALGQLVAGPFDFNAGWGLSRALPLAVDAGADVSLPSQQAFSGGAVYHATGNLHFDIDAVRGVVHWTLGERQGLNFINGGAIVTW